MHVILDAMELMQIPLRDRSLAPAAKLIQSLPAQMDLDFLDPQVVSAIRVLWQDSGVRQCFARSREYQLSRALIFFFFFSFPSFFPACVIEGGSTWQLD
jgi:hypothetical protein